eukprot:362475-Chlamydomonas_euryale.AAC.5
MHRPPPRRQVAPTAELQRPRHRCQGPRAAPPCATAPPPRFAPGRKSAGLWRRDGQRRAERSFGTVRRDALPDPALIDRSCRHFRLVRATVSLVAALVRCVMCDVCSPASFVTFVAVPSLPLAKDNPSVTRDVDLPEALHQAIWLTLQWHRNFGHGAQGPWAWRRVT